MIGFRRHSAQGFSVSKIYYSYRSEDKTYGSFAAKIGICAMFSAVSVAAVRNKKGSRAERLPEWVIPQGIA
jgi:hypothetical protein